MLLLDSCVMRMGGLVNGWVCWKFGVMDHQGVGRMNRPKPLEACVLPHA